MLSHLFVSNYALIDQLNLDFGSGLSIITGETGAGKSILLSALRLVLGERADSAAIKDTDRKCVVEAHFDVSELNLESFFEQNEWEYETETVLRREIRPSGKSRAFVNDSPVTVKMLQKLSKKLIDVHSQFQTAELLNETFQYRWLDAVAGNAKSKMAYQTEFNQWNECKKAIDLLENSKKDFSKEKDYNEFLFEELERASLDTLKLEELEAEIDRLENIQTTIESLAKASQIIENEEFGLMNLMSELQKEAKQFGTAQSSVDLKKRIDEWAIEMNDISYVLQNEIEKTEPNPERLEKLNSQLNLIQLLFNKHQVDSVAELQQIYAELQQKLDAELDVENQLSKWRKLQISTEQRMEILSQKLSKKRKSAAQEIEKELHTSLGTLGMEKAVMKFEITESEVFNKYGKDDLTLLFSANTGMTLQPIAKAVSGGEMSRLMLAIKKSVAQHQALPTLILDEIDTGVSGKIAGEMGKMMQSMGAHLQLISITHLPQVAAKGKHHFRVRKKEENGMTTSEVRELSTEERIDEIAQMLSGDEITQAALTQAKKLMEL